MADVSLAIARPFQRTKWKKLHGIYSYGTLHAAFLSRNEAEKYASDSFENEDEYVIVFNWVKVDAQHSTQASSNLSTSYPPAH